MTPDREETLRLAREIVEAFEHATEHGHAADVHKWRLAELSLALAADLEAAERERDEFNRTERRDEWREGIVNVLDHEGNYLGCMGAESWAWTLGGGIKRMERDLATTREALETICEIGETRDVEVARAALRSLEEK